MKEFMQEKEREYIELINLITKTNNELRMLEADNYIETYKLLCETLAMLYMKEHGYNEMPDFGYVPEFEYDDLIGEYVAMDDYEEMKKEENPAAYQLKTHKLTIVFKDNEREIEYYNCKEAAEEAKECWQLQECVKRAFIEEIIKSSKQAWSEWEELE